MLAIELVTDHDKKTRAIQERNDAIQGAFQRGLLLLGCGQNSIRFIPPLTISRNEINTALSILDEVLSSVENRK